MQMGVCGVYVNKNEKTCMHKHTPLSLSIYMCVYIYMYMHDTVYI